MAFVLGLLVALVLLGAQLGAAIAPARGDVAAAMTRAAACVIGPDPCALLVDELAGFERVVAKRRRAAAAAGREWRGDLETFAMFARALTLDNGRRFLLEDFQRTIVGDYFNGASETLVLIPKKNGKTTLMAALVLYHLCVVDDAECFIAASSKKQAGQLYRFAVRFIRRSPSLQRRVLIRKGSFELRSRRDEGLILILAADSDTADGVVPTLAIVDELHRHKSTALYEVFRDGLDGREGGMLTITTAGDDEDGPLGQMRAAALALPGKKTAGRYTYVLSRDGSFAFHEWGLTPKDDLEDLPLVKSVNPLKAQSLRKLTRRRNSPSMTLHAWARFACNVWTADELAAIAALDWAKIALEDCELPVGDVDEHGRRGPTPGGGPPVIGIDLAWTKDKVGIVPVGYPTAERDLLLIDRRLKVIDTPGDRTGLDPEIVKDAIRELHALWPDATFALDPNAEGHLIASWIIDELCFGDVDRVVTVSQQPASMQSVSMHFAECVRTKHVVEPELDDEDEPTGPRIIPLRHPDHAELNKHLRAAVARYNGERWRFDKRKVPSSASSKVRARPIDAVIAAAIALWVASAPQEEPLEPFVDVIGR